MDIVTIRFKEEVLDMMDRCIADHNFNSRTEFIREAVRDKLAELDREELIKRFMSLKGKAKRHTSDAQRRRVRAQVSKELEREFSKKFGLK